MEWKREWAKHMEGWAFDTWNHTQKVLMAAYKRWFREIFPYEEPSEHQAWDDAEILLAGQLRGFDLEIPLSSGEEGDRSVRVMLFQPSRHGRSRTATLVKSCTSPPPWTSYFCSCASLSA